MYILITSHALMALDDLIFYDFKGKSIYMCGI